MKKFTLLLDGKDLDTGVYDYFPYSDKYIVDFRNTRKVIKDLRDGKSNEEAENYIYAKYCLANEDTNRLAIESSYKAFNEFKKFPLKVRKKIFLDMYKSLIKNKEEFINLLVIEGHPRKLAEWEFEGMQIGSSPETIDFYCKQLRKEVGRHQNEILYLARKPDGVVCLNPPSNAAASNSYNGILTFLVGNTMIIKPPLHSPLSTIFLWKEIVYKALMANNVPPGTLNIVLGNHKTIMDEWLSSPHVNDIIYFGQSKTGLDVGGQIFLAGKKPILELSGNDLFLAWKDADVNKSTESLLECFLGSTQICMVPKIALIHENIYEKLVNSLLVKVKRLKISLPNDPDVILSPVAKIKDFFDFLNDALEKGAKIISGGQRVNHLDQEDKDGMFIRPTLIKVENFERLLEMKFLKEEIFFPLLPLIKISGKDEAVFEKMSYLVNNHAYGLRVSLWILSAMYLRKFAKELDNCGLLRINSRHVGFSYYLSTHGGTRRTGGPFGEMNYFWQKTSHLQGVTRTIK